jgi:DNA-binding CsgD family transcriptional regulator/N-acetylneuraminic acid mutarotase
MTKLEGNELSERELEILRLVATGASNKEIAQKLFISPNTVKVHLKNIFGKVGVQSRTEAAMYAIKKGLLEIGLQNKLFQGGTEDSSRTLPADPIPSEQQNTNFLSKSIKFISIPLFLISILLVLYFLVFRKGISPEQSEQPVQSQVASTEWIAVNNLLFARSNFAVVQFEDSFIIIGGQTENGISDTVESFNITTNEKNFLEHKPTPVTDIQAATIQRKIYVPGGITQQGNPTNILEVYDPINNKWETSSPMPVALSAYALVSFEGLLYVFGGWNGNQYVDQSYEFNPASDIWKELPPMPVKRGYANAVVAGGKIYVIGGFDGTNYILDNNIFTPFFSGEEGSSWKYASSLPEGRSAMGVVNLTDTLYLVGGKNGTKNDKICMAYFPLTDEWAYLRDFPRTNAYSLGAGTIGGELYILGGIIGDKPSTEINSYKVLYSISIPIIIK